MIQLQDISNIEKKFQDAFAGTLSLEDKVKSINELRQELKAYKRQVTKQSLEKKLKDVSIADNSSLEDKVKIIVELHRELKAQKGRKDEVKIIKKLIHNLEGRMDRAAKKIAEDLKKIAGFKQKFEGKDVFTSKKVAEFESNKKSQTTLEGKISDQNKQEKISVQTDTVQPSVSKDPIKDKPSDKKPEISLKQVSVDRNATEKNLIIKNLS